MKTLLTLDEAFNSENIVETEHAIFQMSKVGIYDRSFFLTALANSKSTESRENIGNCIPFESAEAGRFTLQ